MKHLLCLLLALLCPAIGASNLAHEIAPHANPHSENHRHCAEKRMASPMDHAPTLSTGDLRVLRQEIRHVSKTAQSKMAACSAAEFASLSGFAFTDAVATATDACLGTLWTFDSNVQFAISEARVQEVVNAIQSESPDLANRATRIDQYLYYLQIAFYHEFYQSGVTYSSSLVSQAGNVVASVGTRSAFFTESTDFMNLRYQWSITIDSTNGTQYALSPLQSMLERFRNNPALETEYYERWAAFNLFFTLARQVGNNAGAGANSPWYNLINSSLMGVIRDYALDTTYDDNTQAIIENAIYTLGQFSALNPTTKNNSHAYISQAYNLHTQYSGPWFRALTDLDYFYNATLYNGTVLDIDAIKADVKAIALPNTFTFGGGLITFECNIPRETAELLYDAIAEVRGQFFRKTTFLDPTPGDPNESLTLVIYASPADYQQFQPFLYGLNTNNGGIYIENWATLFTYERTPQDSYLTLEDLLRHEYVHYLDGRYVIVPSFYEGPIYDGDRLTWYNEGLAEWLVGSTRKDEILPRNTYVDIIGNDSSRMTVYEILNASYNSGFRFYNYACLLFNYFNESRPELLVELFDRIRSDDPAAVDALYSQIWSDSSIQSGYDAYIDARLAERANGTGTWDEDVPTVRTPTSLPGDNAIQLEIDLDSVSPSDGTLVVKGDRYEYSGTISLTASGNEAAVRAQYEGAMNDLLSDLEPLGNNFTSAVSYFGNLSINGSSSTASFVVEGPYTTTGTGDTTPPANPTNLVATGGQGQVSLIWDANQEADLAGYHLYRASQSGGPYTRVSGSLLTGTSYTDGVAAGTYYYVLTATDTSGNASGYSGEASATATGDTTPPSAPTNLSANGITHAISLNWSAVGASDLAGYHVYRATSAGGPYSQLTGSLQAGTTYTDSVSSGTVYYYVVTASDASGNESSNSNEASAEATAPSGGPPALVTGIAAVGGAGNVTVTWNANSESDLAGYEVWRAEPGTSWTLVTASLLTTTTYVDTNVVEGGYYYYLIRAKNTSGEVSPWPTAVAAAPTSGGGTGNGILVVNDHYSGSTTYVSEIEDALDNLSKTYDSWIVANDGAPTASDLSAYAVVIWSVGYYHSGYSSQFSSSSQTAIEGFLGNGGNLFFSGAYVSLYHDNSSLYTNYFHATHVQHDMSLPGIVPTGNGPVTSTGWYSFDSNYYQSEVDISGPAVACYIWDPYYGANQSSGTSVFTIDSTYKLTYLAFPYSQLTNYMAETLLSQSLTWMGQ